MIADPLEAILDRAAVVYARGSTEFRGVLLETGRLLHEYVLAGLRQDVGSASTRARRGLTRNALVKRAASRLGIKPARVGQFIACAMVVDLLSDGCDLGALSHGAITRFGAFVERCRGTTELIAGRPDVGGPPSESLETWRIKTGFEESAKTLFRRAVDERFDQSQTREEVKALYRRGRNAKGQSSRPGGRPVGQSKPSFRHEPRESFAEQLRASAHVASPKDVAEMCLSLVDGAADPEAVATRLVGLLDQYLAKRRSPAERWRIVIGGAS